MRMAFNLSPDEMEPKHFDKDFLQHSQQRLTAPPPSWQEMMMSARTGLKSGQPRALTGRIWR